MNLYSATQITLKFIDRGDALLSGRDIEKKDERKNTT